MNLKEHRSKVIDELPYKYIDASLLLDQKNQILPNSYRDIQ